MLASTRVAAPAEVDMARRPVALVLLALLLGAGLLSPQGVASAGPAGRDGIRFRHLDPGGQPRLAERVPVTVVLIGHDRRTVDARALRRSLPRTYEPVVRSRFWYGQVEKLGIRYSYDHRVKVADRRYEDRFFRHLSSIATDAPLTQFQEAYNDQAGLLDVTDNAYVDATRVERWLASHPPRGVDTRENTVYLVNWWGRSDFRFHVYTKTGEPDPDTGYDFGVERDSRKVSAWGGTTARDEESGLGKTQRVWFHDLSAGPEGFAGGFDVTNPDLDGDGVADYRIPPAWEYSAGGYRAPDALTGDLSKIVRYVALNLLMTSSPIYPVELPTEEPPTSIDLDSNTYEGWPGVDASTQYTKPGLVVDELSELLLNRKRLSYDDQDLPLTGFARACYEGWLTDTDCTPDDPYPPGANLYVQNLEELARTQDDTGRVDYELPIFNYAVGTDDPTPLGFAEDNWVDGTQTFVFNFINPFIVEAGYGLSTTQIHEVGHHVGLSHPHDGYDSQGGFDYGPTGDFYFAWLGTYVNSMMSYIDLNWDFSQFDQDNMARFQAAAYVEAANRLAAEALAAPRARRAHAELRLADVFVGLAEKRFAQHRYPEAWAAAGRAYALAVRAARRAGVDVGQSIRAALGARTAGPVQEADVTEGAVIDTLEPDGPRMLP